jgi:hypothetical protein
MYLAELHKVRRLPDLQPRLSAAVSKSGAHVEGWR